MLCTVSSRKKEKSQRDHGEDPDASHVWPSTTVDPVSCALMFQSKLANFLPAVSFCMVWMFWLTSGRPLDAHVPAAANITARPLGTSFLAYYPMTIAMIAGSLIAGSTPLGGGVVAFPVAVLFIGFTPEEGRDFSVMIQTVGMNAAAYLIMLRKPHLLDFNLISTFVVVGLPGVIFGLVLDLPPFYIVLIFQVLVLEFACVFFYLNVLAPREALSLRVVPAGEAAVVPKTLPITNIRKLCTYASMALAAFTGGLLTANVGSGADVLLYAYGLLCWNLLVPQESLHFSDAELTACSVVVMGLLSLATTLCRVLTSSITDKVLHCWGATAWLVWWGAPLGSMLLTPHMRARLRIAFYLLALLQFIGFAILKIKDKADAWAIFGGFTAALFCLLAVHWYVAARKLADTSVTARETLTLAVFHKRLFK